MIVRHQQNRRRTAATTVEFAFVAMIVLLFLFGILEYCRYIFMYDLTTNAARDAARFACVRTSGGTVLGEPATVTTADVVEVWRSGIFNSNRYGTGMCGLENNLAPYTCQVYSIPAAQMALDPPNTDPSGKPAWNAAPFHDTICVRVSGTYRPVVSNLIGFTNSVPFTIYVMMASEAN